MWNLGVEIIGRCRAPSLIPLILLVSKGLLVSIEAKQQGIWLLGS
jgi:hypothetical protein